METASIKQKCETAYVCKIMQQDTHHLICHNTVLMEDG